MTTPMEVAANLVGSANIHIRAMGVAMMARSLSDDDGLRQGWPVDTSIEAAVKYFDLPADPEFYQLVKDEMPKVSDAMLNKGASR